MSTLYIFGIGLVALIVVDTLFVLCAVILSGRYKECIVTKLEEKNEGSTRVRVYELSENLNTNPLPLSSVTVVDPSTM